MNCNVNYEDPPEEEESGPITSPKTVSWKSVVSTTFKTPQKCVGQNRNIGAWMRAGTHGAQMRAGTHGAQMRASTHEAQMRASTLGAQMRASTHVIQGENSRRHAHGMSG